MTKAKWFVTGVLFAMMALALVIAPPSALAAKKDMVKVKGYISAVGTSTVEITDAAANVVTVNVVEKTKIHKNHVEGASLEDLAVGDKVKVKYDSETLDAKRIQAKSPKAHGVITALGTDSVTIENADGVEVTVMVDENTKVKLNDQKVTLADLAIGQEAKAKYDPTTGIAKHVHAWDGSDDGDDS